jgi:hypothetical protein
VSDQNEKDPVVTLATMIFKLGREVEKLATIHQNQLELGCSLAWDKGFAAGRDSVEKELGLDERAVLLKPKPPAGGTGAPAAN